MPKTVTPMVTSLSARRAWIEIGNNSSMLCNVEVALRKESVDRNAFPFRLSTQKEVALRKESVDRNFLATLLLRMLQVALRKESVDRNIAALCGHSQPRKSLSARRAWIEIKRRC